MKQIMENGKWKMENYKLHVILLLCYISIIYYQLSIIHLHQASAASLALSISPPLLEVIIKPGKSITQVYKLTNTGEAVVITVKLMELATFGIKEEENFTRDKWISIISNDIDFDKPFLLQGGKEAEFLLRVNPPADTTEADYYRAIVFTTTPAPPTDTTMTSFVQNLASPVIITVTNTGILVKEAQIINFELPKILDSFDVLTTNVEIKNSGKNYFHTPGKFTLKGPFVQASYDLIPRAILSGQTKQLITQNAPPEDTENKTLYLPGFYIGKYQLTLDFTLDETTTKVTASKTFYAVPWKGLLLVILLIIGIKVLKLPKLLKRKKS